MKDWFLGSSWALGIPTLGGVPYSNGRNQESSSEAVNAYDAVALYGHVMAQVGSVECLVVFGRLLSRSGAWVGGRVAVRCAFPN